MKHMSHPDAPDFVVEADAEREITLAQAGWQYIKPGPKPDDKK